MMAQIPSGLQALMQASQVLQQEASPVAPGPQGPQPTVASRIAQQIEQAPSMQMMGEQAGIAGAIQNQQVARNQQMAQDPRAVAQMAAQMLGIAQNPVDMQFKEGGIIGFANEGRVVDPDVEQFEDRQLVDQIKNVLRSSGEGAVAAMKDLYPPKLFVQALQELGEVGSRAARAVGIDVPKYTAPPIAPNIESFFRQQYGPRGTTMRGETMTIPETLDLSQPRQPASATVGGEDMPETPAPVAMTPEQMMPPGVFSGREAPAVQAAGQEPQIVRADETVDTSAARGVAGIAQALQRPLTSPQVAIRSLPDILKEARGQIPPEMREAFKDVQAKQQAEMAIRQARPDLEKEASEALTRADTERKRLLDLKRSSDTFTRLNALFSSLYSRGNEVEAADKAIMAREEGAIAAQLAHDQAIIKLKEAKEARKLGDAEKATALAKEALSFYKTEQDIVNKLLEMNVKLEGDRAQVATAERGIESRERMTVAQLLADSETKLETARNRAAEAKERNAERMKLAKDETERKLAADKERVITQAQDAVNDGYSRLKTVRDAYGMIANATPEMLKDPGFKSKYEEFKQDYDGVKATIDQAERRLNKLLGEEAPVSRSSSAPRQRYDASGNPIR